MWGLAFATYFWTTLFLILGDNMDAKYKAALAAAVIALLTMLALIFRDQKS